MEQINGTDTNIASIARQLHDFNKYVAQVYPFMKPFAEKTLKSFCDTTRFGYCSEEMIESAQSIIDSRPLLSLAKIRISVYLTGIPLLCARYAMLRWHTNRMASQAARDV